MENKLFPVNIETAAGQPMYPLTCSQQQQLDTVQKELHQLGCGFAKGPFLKVEIDSLSHYVHYGRPRSVQNFSEPQFTCFPFVAR